MTRHRSSAGFTFVELMVAIAVLSLLVAAFTRVFASSSELTADSRAALRAGEETRRGLDYLANILRAVAWDTVEGFDENGVATTPSWKTLEGSDGNGPIYSATKMVAWRATTGASAPGEVVVTEDGKVVPLVSRVPVGGFRVTLTGNELKINLSVRYSTAEAVTATSSASISISLRN